MSEQKLNILVSTAFPFSVRNFIETGLIADIKKELGAEVQVVSPYNKVQLPLPDGSHVTNHWVKSKHQTTGLPVPEGSTWFDDVWRAIHMTGFAQEFPNGSLMTMNQNNPARPKWWAARLFRLLAPQHTKRREWCRWINHIRRPRRARIVEIFDICKPGLVLVASPGHYGLDQFIMEEASRRGIPTLCIVLSWDNLYSRGPLIRRPDILAVWSEEMKRQAMEVHQFPSERIRIVGSLQFGFYADPVTADDLREIRGHIGLAATEPYIAYVCGSRTSRYDCEDVIQLIGALKKTEFAHLRIVVRPHPQGDRKAYAELKEFGVLIDQSPDITSEGAPSDAMNEKAAKHMASFLSGSSFVVSSWGTTALLEACLFDRPAVQLRWFDSVEHKNPDEILMVKRFQKYLHMECFDSIGARLFSDRPDDLANCLRTLQSSDFDFHRRRKETVARIVALPVEECKLRAISACRETIEFKRFRRT